MANVATARAMTFAIGSLPTPHRVDPENIGGDHDRGVALLVELPRDERAEIGQGRLWPVDRRHPVARLPVALPGQVVTGAMKQTRVGADRELPHASHDDQLDVPDLRPRDERIYGVPSRWVAHGIGTVSITSSITVSTRMLRLLAWGASQIRWPRTYLASSCMSSG